MKSSNADWQVADLHEHMQVVKLIHSLSKRGEKFLDS